MATYFETGLLVFYALAVWWGATGIILWLNSRAETTYRTSLIGVSLLAAVGLFAAVVASTWETTAGALIGFTGALSLWALNEMLFLMGVIVGRHEGPPPADEQGWLRFKRASLAIAYHEAALVLTLILLGVVFYGSPNPTAFWVFALLWAMRLSTKLNIFLGVPNTAAELLPSRISYLSAYFRTGRPSALFPVSVAAASITALTIYVIMVAPDAAPQSSAAGTLLLTFALLGLFEHLLLAAPFSTGALWGWRPNGADRSGTPTLNAPSHLGPATQRVNPVQHEAKPGEKMEDRHGLQCRVFRTS